MPSDRLEALKGLVAQNPSDSRTRYMLAMELTRQGDFEAAVQEYTALVAADADYVAAYYHGGQALERLDRIDEARVMYKRGIEACERTGDGHTKAELEGVLELLGEH